MRLGLWSLVPLSKIYHNEVSVMVFNATFNNILWLYIQCTMKNVITDIVKSPCQITRTKTVKMNENNRGSF